MGAQPEKKEVGFAAGWASCQADVCNLIEVEIKSLQELKKSGQEAPWADVDDVLSGMQLILTMVEHLRE